MAANKRLTIVRQSFDNCQTLSYRDMGK